MILVNTSVWITFLHKGDEKLRNLLQEQKVYTTEIVLLELLPVLNIHKKYKEVIDNFKNLQKTSSNFANEDWEKIYKYRTLLLQNELNGVGIPDLMLIHICKEKNITIYSHDKHFEKAAEILNFETF